MYRSHLQRLLACLLAISIFSGLYAQSDRRISVSAGAHLNGTMYDQFKSNNSVGLGPDLKLFIKLTPRVDVLIDATGEIYGGTRVGVLDANGNYIEGKNGGVAGLQGGVAFRITHNFRATLTAGVCSFENESHFAFRPGLILIPGGSKRLRLNLSFTNVSQDVPGDKHDFGYLSFGIGVRVF